MVVAGAWWAWRGGSGLAPEGGGPVTTAQLYQLYCQCYGEFYREHGGLLLGQRRPLSGVEAVVMEFAAEDAANGTPLRSPAQFETAIEAGLDALMPLGLRRGAA
jgi:hypothetical protein